jgi:hypothetical protein
VFVLFCVYPTVYIYWHMATERIWWYAPLGESPFAMQVGGIDDHAGGAPQALLVD